MLKSLHNRYGVGGIGIGISEEQNRAAGAHGIIATNKNPYARRKPPYPDSIHKTDFRPPVFPSPFGIRVISYRLTRADAPGDDPALIKG